MTTQCFRIIKQDVIENNDLKPIPQVKIMSYEEKTVGSTSFFKCEACPYMALAEDDIKFHLFTFHPDLAKRNGLADNIQIPCPGCNSIFDVEETLRIHLRNHHKMGIKDVKKMVKSLIQIALKNVKLKKENKETVLSAPVPVTPEVAEVKMPQVIEIVPDVTVNNAALPNGVTFISVDELQNMSTPNFQDIDPKNIIEEASINILYTENVSTQYASVTDTPTSSSHNIIQMSNVTPDLISSIQPRPPGSEQNTLNQSLPQQNCDIKSLPLKKQGRPFGSCTLGLTSNSKIQDNSKDKVSKKFTECCMMPGCNMRFKSTETLLYHNKCHQNGTLQCPECNAVFSCLETLHTHLWKLHTIDMELPTCEICNYKTHRRKRLNMHMKIHSEIKSYTCSDCPRSFKSSTALAKHRQYHRKVGDQSNKCELCERQFNSQRRLRSHISAVHEKLRPFKCSYCDFSSARNSELTLHIRSHTGDKPYSCDQCEYKCSDHNSLRRHKKRHTKESLYKCEYCPYSTIQSTMFKSHMINKHPDSASNIFRCPYCIYKSLSKEKYITHISSHTDKEGIKQITQNLAQSSKPIWTIPSDTTQYVGDNKTIPGTDQEPADPENNICNKTVNYIPIEVDDCDSQQEALTQNYPKNYCTNGVNDSQLQTDYSVQDIATDLSKDDTNSDCIISETSNDIAIDRQYPPISLQNINYSSTQNFLSTPVSLNQGLIQCTNVNSLVSSTNFPIHLPVRPQISVRNNITLRGIDKIHLPVNKITGIIKPTQILPGPLLSNSHLFSRTELEGVPRKKPKISVKSNLILKGPDQENMFHSQQKMAFKQLEDNERFGLNSQMTFNNLISTQFMQHSIPPVLNEPTLSESPNTMIPFSQETMLNTPTEPIENRLNDNPQIFNFNPPINVNAINLLPPPQKIQTTDPSYIKIEATIKQNTQSPSLEKMCSSNALINNQAISREYKASPPLEEINKNINDIKNEVKSDAFYNMTIADPAPNALIMDQYLLDNIIGEQYAGHLDLSNLVLPEQVSNLEDQQNDVIEIDDNSDDNKLLPRFDMNFPLESLYLMNCDFHCLDNDIQPQSANNLQSEVPVNEINRMVNEVPIMNQNKTIPVTSEVANKDSVNLIHSKQDPMMNTTARLNINKINVKNIELMKN